MRPYDAAGVDTRMEDEAVATLRGILNKTFGFNPHIKRVTGLAYFAGLVDVGLPKLLAICTDGVGTKLLVAQMMDKYDTIGIDCVAMNANDVICVGAEPVAFVDYLAVQKPDPELLKQIAIGLSTGAKAAKVAICGGEVAQIAKIITGERPDRGFDLAGTCVGLVEKDRAVLGADVKPGDAILGLQSSGLHSNGFSLARRIIFETKRFTVETYIDELEKTIGEELLIPTHIYVAEVLELLSSAVEVKALVNITGDGLLNLSRIAAPNVGFEIDALPEPHPIFTLLKEWGAVDDEEMYRVFNMGIGFCLIVPDDSEQISQAISITRKHGVGCTRIGTVVSDAKKRVRIPAKGLVQDGLFFVKEH